MPVLAKLINTDLSRSFIVAQVAEKHGSKGSRLHSWQNASFCKPRDCKKGNSIKGGKLFI
jgi:hypothetical protein